jgi:hypothetical protein
MEFKTKICNRCKKEYRSAWGGAADSSLCIYCCEKRGKEIKASSELQMARKIKRRKKEEVKDWTGKAIFSKLLKDGKIEFRGQFSVIQNQPFIVADCPTCHKDEATIIKIKGCELVGCRACGEILEKRNYEYSKGMINNEF